MTTIPNTADTAYWNSPATRVWATGHARIDAIFAPVLAAALAAAAPQPGERVIDIGCGSGTSVLALAAAVGPGGEVLGADVAAESVAVARRRIEQAGLTQAAVVLGDAGSHPFPQAGFDLLFSRFGVMFFADPVAAFRHLRRALRPGGRFCAAAFRAPAENPWVTGPAAALRPLLPPQPAAGPDAPGQFGWARAAHVRSILDGAGFGDVALTPCDLRFRLGEDAAGAAEAAMSIGQAARALLGADAATRDSARMALEAWFRPHEGPDGVALPAALWIVTARA
ncbi:class I SAM-dependent methyltransferase [Dankookia sp. GCM10030260]|uniref:class I SAM-dependent methyltransferase n=1 Tax=Dankookia sp. GCM10030260 TaxID=3273390 RepID=UPI003618D856